MQVTARLEPACGFADDQFGIDAKLEPHSVDFVVRRNPGMKSRVADLGARDVDRGKGRVDELRKPDVVATGDRDVLGNLQAALPELLEHSERDEVIDSDYRRRLKTWIQKVTYGQLASLRAVLVRRRSEFHLAAVLLHRIQKGFLAAEQQRQPRMMSNKVHPPVPHRIDVFHRLTNPLLIIDPDLVDILCWHALIVQDNRQVHLGKFLHQRQVHLRNNKS